MPTEYQDIMNPLNMPVKPPVDEESKLTLDEVLGNVSIEDELRRMQSDDQSAS